MTVEIRIFLIGIAIGLVCGSIVAWDYAYGVKRRANRTMTAMADFYSSTLADMQSKRDARGRFVKREAQ